VRSKTKLEGREAVALPVLAGGKRHSVSVSEVYSNITGSRSRPLSLIIFLYFGDITLPVLADNGKGGGRMMVG
jgi:hypothetical protein